MRINLYKWLIYFIKSHLYIFETPYYILWTRNKHVTRQIIFNLNKMSVIFIQFCFPLRLYEHLKLHKLQIIIIWELKQYIQNLNIIITYLSRLEIKSLTHSLKWFWWWWLMILMRLMWQNCDIFWTLNTFYFK